MTVRSVRKSPTIKSSPTVFTIGHSTRTLDELVQLLRGHGIERLVDVRTIPRSRHNPQFNHEILGKALHNRRFSYRHMKSLGGLRHARRDSINTGWRNASFRGFADCGVAVLFVAEPGALVAVHAHLHDNALGQMKLQLRQGGMLLYALAPKAQLLDDGYEDFLETLGLAFMGACR